MLCSGIDFYPKDEYIIKGVENAIIEKKNYISREVNHSVTELNSDYFETHIRTAEVGMLHQKHVDKPLQGVFSKHLERHGFSKELTFFFI